MRVLGTAVLAFEWLVLALAIPVAVNTAGVAPGPAWLVFGIASVLIVGAIATVSRPAGWWLGWAVQLVAIAAGIVVPLLVILGVIFAGLWFAAIRVGRRVDQIRAARAESDGAVPSAGTAA